jgi:hypothetical protein
MCRVKKVSSDVVSTSGARRAIRNEWNELGKLCPVGRIALTASRMSFIAALLRTCDDLRSANM